MTQTTHVSPAMRRFILAVDRFAVFVGEHWLLLVVFALLVLNALTFLAPILMHYGYTAPAQAIYTLYRLTCHELAYRSYFLFGAQPVYTLDQLRAVVAPQNEDLLFWSGFQGNATLGYKMAWCERDAAMYLSLLIASLLFGLVRTRLRPLDWRIYAALLTPMAIDGFTQLFGWRESDYLLRGITGILFGFGSAWLIYPHLERAMRDVQAQARAQWERAVAYEASLRAPPIQRKPQ